MMKHPIRTSLHVTVILFVMALVYSDICADGGKTPQSTKPAWDKAKVEEYLGLPYNHTFNPGEARIQLSKLDGIKGVENFAVSKGISRIPPHKDTTYGGVSFTVCSPDLSLFEITITKPTSSHKLCVSLSGLATTTDLWSDIPKYFVPYSDSKTGVYSLLCKRAKGPEKWYLDSKRGYDMHVRYIGSVNKAPANSYVLVAQIDAIIESLTGIINDGGKTGTKAELYRTIKQVVQDTQKRQLSKRDTGSESLSLHLLERITCPEKETIELKTVESTITDSTCLLRLEGSQKIPVIKIADPGEILNASCRCPESAGPEDILIILSRKGRDQQVQLGLRSDGDYEVTFRRPGEHVVKLLYIGKTGEVTHSGELTVNVSAPK